MLLTHSPPAISPMMRHLILAGFTLLFGGSLLARPGSLEALLPPNLENDEAALLQAARAVEPELLAGGYRRYQLVAAHLAAWTEDGAVDKKDLQIDLFLPGESHDGPYPLLVYVHGGGFMGGNPFLNVFDERREFSRSFRYTLDHGVALASIGYRLAREGGWPAPVSDPLCGMRFLQQNGEHWNLQTDALILVGHSAGARSVALIGMVPQDDFHTQDLPWQNRPVNIAGTYLWAGAAYTRPEIEAFGEFGKPRWYSVPRLHHGEHPAWTESTRQSLRIRHNLPHISNTMPPLYMVRGASDYGGDHSDAETAVALWRDLGIEATLSIVPGGHSAAGPPEDLLAFINRHLREQPFIVPTADVLLTGRVLLDHQDPWAALEVLTAKHTTAGGTDIGPGEWIYPIHDFSLVWLPDHDAWPEEHQELARQARQMAAEHEARAARDYFSREDWFRAAEAARNVRKLIGTTPGMKDLLDQVEQGEQAEATFFQTLHRANQSWRQGQKEQAGEILARLEDPRLEVLRATVKAGFPGEVPAWADQHGVDLYGPWVAIELAADVTIHLRWIESGEWDLPEHLHYQLRGRVEDETVTRVEVKKGFWLAETPVTQAQWNALLRDELIKMIPGQTDLPRVRIDYLEIIAWLQTLSQSRTDLVARLPTEPEWIHAATGGGRKNVRGGTDVHSIHALNVDPDNPAPLPVTGLTPDLLGLQGMIGGVLEWTASGDRREARFNDDRGRLRIFRYPMSRGGAWSSLPHVLGVETREWHRHGNRQPDLGFRLAIGGDATAENWFDDVVRR